MSMFETDEEQLARYKREAEAGDRVIADYRDRLAQAEARVRELEEQLENELDHSERARGARSLEEFNLREKVRELETNLTASRGNHEASVRLYGKQVADLQDQLRINSLTRCDQEEEINRLEAKVRELEAERDEAGNTILDLRATNAQLLAELADYRTNYVPRDPELDGALGFANDTTLRELTAQFQELECQRDEARDERDEQKAIVAAARITARERIAEIERLKALAADAEGVLKARIRELEFSNETLRQCVRARESDALDSNAEADELRAKVLAYEAERDRLRESGDALFLSTIGFSPDVQMASARVGWKNARCRAASASATGSAKVATECIHLRAYRNERTQDDWCPDCGAIRYAETIRDEGSSDGWLKPTAVTLVADAARVIEPLRELEKKWTERAALCRRTVAKELAKEDTERSLSRAAAYEDEAFLCDAHAEDLSQLLLPKRTPFDPDCAACGGTGSVDYEDDIGRGSRSCSACCLKAGGLPNSPPEAVAGQAAVEPVTYADLQVIARAIDAPSNRTRFGGAASIADRARDALRKVHAVLLEAQPAAEQGHLSTVAAVAESLPVSEEDERTVDAMVARVQGETRPIEREADERAGAEQDDEP